MSSTDLRRLGIGAPVSAAAYHFSTGAPSRYHVAMLKDRVALISGAATGIGEAVARLFASQGAHTFMLDRDLATCRTVADSIVSAGGAATAFGGDVRRRQDVAAWVETAISAFGRIDVLVNNAGICHPEVERDQEMLTTLPGTPRGTKCSQRAVFR